MSLKTFLRFLPRSNSLNSFCRVPHNARFSTDNKGSQQEDIEMRDKATEFIKKRNVDVGGFQVNEESIRKKQAEGRRDQELNMGNYTIRKPNQHYDPKTNPNPTLNVFSFHEDVLLQRPSQVQIYGLANGYFTVNDVWYPGSIVAFPRQVFLWDIQTAADIRPHSFDFIDVVKPTPNYIIIGTGKDKYPLEESIYKRFRDRQIKVDVLPTFEACSTYNVCNEDGLNICAFLIPANL